MRPKIPKVANKEWFDGTHLIRRVGDTSRLESAMADPQGNRIGDFELVKGRAVWAECIGFVRRMEYKQRAGEVLESLAS